MATTTSRNTKTRSSSGFSQSTNCTSVGLQHHTVVEVGHASFVGDVVHVFYLWFSKVLALLLTFMVSPCIRTSATTANKKLHILRSSVGDHVEVFLYQVVCSRSGLWSVERSPWATSSGQVVAGRVVIWTFVGRSFTYLFPFESMLNFWNRVVPIHSSVSKTFLSSQRVLAGVIDACSRLPHDIDLFLME